MSGHPERAPGRGAKLSLFAAGAGSLLAVACDVRAGQHGTGLAPELATPEGRTLFAALVESEQLTFTGTQRFVLGTDHSPVDARAACEVAEEASRRLDELLGRVPPPGRSVILWIDDETRFAEMMARCGHDGSGSLEGASGFFSRRCGFVHVGRIPGSGSFGRTASAISHECVHQRLWIERVSVVRGPGAWIDEGLATWLEAIPTREGAESVSSGRRAQAAALSVADMLLPLEHFVSMEREELLRLRPVEVVYSQGGRVHKQWVSLLHVEAFALTKFLEGMLQDRFPDFVRRAIATGGTRFHIEEAAGRQIADVQGEFTIWIERGDSQTGRTDR